MAALTRGRAILQENRTLVLGNSLTVKPFPASSSVLRKPQNPVSGEPIVQVPQRSLATFSNRPPIRAPTLRTQIVPTIAQMAFIERSYADDKKVMLSEDVDLNKLNFGEPLKVKGTSKIIPIHYETDIKTLKLQTPLIRIPFGVNRFNNQDNSSASSTFTIQFTFDNMDKNPEMKRFYDLITSIEEKVLKMAEKNSKLWFDREIPAPVLQHTFKKGIKQASDPKYPPTFKVKVPVTFEPETKKMVPQVNIFVDKAPATLEDLAPNSKVVGIIELKYVWSISGTMLGTTWNLLQVKIVDKPEARDSGKLHGTIFSFQTDFNFGNDFVATLNLSNSMIGYSFIEKNEQ